MSKKTHKGLATEIPTRHAALGLKLLHRAIEGLRVKDFVLKENERN